MPDICPYEMSPVKTLSIDEQKKLFKVGEKIYIRPNGKEFTNYWAYYMNFMINKGYYIYKIVDSFKFIGKKYKLHKDVMDHDLIIYAKNDRDNVYYFHYKSVFHPNQRIPDYKPRYKKND